MSNLYDTAKWYNEVLGLNVIPLSIVWNKERAKQEKKPLVPWLPYKEQRVDPEDIKKWWTKEHPNAGIASVVGSISGLVVVDCDSQEAINEFESILPDSVLVPCVETLRGGRHYYFACNEVMQKKVGFLPHMDFQAEGSLIVLPPTRSINGTQYTWLAKPENRQDFPSIDIIKDSYIYSACKEPVRYSLQNLTPLTTANIWDDGVRDDNLWHVAYSLAKTNNRDEYINQVLTAIVWSWGERDEAWIKAKVRSAMDRQDRKMRNLKKEIEEYISLQPDYISLTDCLQTLQLHTREEKNHAYVIFNRLIGILIEKHGGRRGEYRKINKTVEKTKFIQEKIKEFPVKLPFGLNEEVKLYPKSVVVVAGSKGSGKTALALKIAKDNQDIMPVVYMHSEGGDEEFSDRMQNWGITDASEIRFDAIKCSKDFHDLVTDEKKIFIIDFLEVHKEFFEIAIPLKKIHDKLVNGIAIVCIQKKAGALYGRGDEFSQEVSRLYLSMEYLKDEQQTKITIVNAKAPKNDENLTGWWRKVKITRKGTQLTPQGTKWDKPIFESDEKPKSKYRHWQDGKN